MDDTQPYIQMDCKGGNPVSSLGVGGNSPWKKINCSPHLEVTFGPCVSGNLHKIWCDGLPANPWVSNAVACQSHPHFSLSQRSGWCSGILPCLPPLGPQFESYRGHYVDWVFNPYFTAWVFPGIILWGFRPTSKTEVSSASSLLVWL